MEEFEGSITLRGKTIYGWAFDRSDPNKHLHIELFADGEKIGEVTANIFRQDLLKAHKGHGDHGFYFNLAGRVNRDSYISAKVKETNFILNNSSVFFSGTGTSEKGDKNRLKVKFCSMPFHKIVIGEGGNVYLCCPAYLPSVIGNAFNQSFEEIWNSATAIDIRRSILDGDYKYCLDECPAIRKNTLIDREFVKDSRYVDSIKNNNGYLHYGPQHLSLLHDRSCNLYCPSCRTERYTAYGSEKERLRKLLDNFIQPALPFVNTLEFAGGELFASRHLLEIITSINKEKLPNLKIEIYTNGTLVNEYSWNKIKNVHGLIKSIYVSLDATTKDTFEDIRRGAIFERVWKNLEFISMLRRAKEIERFGILFVVQARNFREMKDFVMLGKRLNCDYVGFSQLLKEGIYAVSSGEFEKQNIFSADHPEHRVLIDLLQDPLFSDPLVDLRNLSGFLINKQYDRNF